MSKGKSTWKYNKLLTARRNYFTGGGDTKSTTGLFGLDWSNPFKSSYIKNKVAGAVGGAVGNVAGSLIGGGYSSGAGSTMRSLSGIASAIPGPWGAAASAALSIGAGVTDRFFGSKMNTENIAKVEANINALNNFQSDASNFDQLAQNWSNAVGGIEFSDSFIGSDGVFSNKAKNKAASLRSQVAAGKLWANNSLNNNAENISDTQMGTLLGNYLSLGGNLLSKGGSIYIKPENRGKFTETKRRTGKTTEELTHSKNSLTRKRAIFAQNAKKWHHAFGGELNTQGGDFTNGLLYIDSGGSHESNPNEGVPFGYDQNGIPNLVEEGETVFNDYVFSKRLRVPKALRKKYKLGGDLSYAEASKKLAKESEERPNDPISMRGLEYFMQDLAMSQEVNRAKNNNRKFSKGGNLFVGGGDTAQQRTPVYFPFDTTYNTAGWFVSSAANSANNSQASTQGSSSSTKNTSRKKKTKTTLTSTAQTPPSPSQPKITYEYKVKGNDNLTDLPENARYYSGYNFDTGKTWAELYGDKYSFDISKDYEDQKQSDGSIIRRYFYTEKTPKTSKVKTSNKVFSKGADGKYTQIDGDDPYTTLFNSGNYSLANRVQNSDGSYNYYYDPIEEKTPVEPRPTWMRYTPAAALGVTSLTDALGLTNKPDYTNADTIAEMYKGTGLYRPVSFSPLGNYLTYRPFDRDYYLNKMSSEAGTTRRNLLNTSGGNRATAMAGLLAADSSYLGKIGELARQAEEYNMQQRQAIADFNRETDSINSSGMFQADSANQKAFMEARSQYLKGMETAATMREKARLTSDAARSANLSNFITSLGDIGRENMAWNWRDFYKETQAPVAAELEALLGDTSQTTTSTTSNKDNNKSKAKGGKIKRRKGLTY